MHMYKQAYNSMIRLIEFSRNDYFVNVSAPLYSLGELSINSTVATQNPRRSWFSDKVCDYTNYMCGESPSPKAATTLPSTTTATGEDPLLPPYYTPCLASPLIV